MAPAILVFSMEVGMNPWCQALRIPVPRLEDVVGHKEASSFSLLLVALLEFGTPITLERAAIRIAQAGDWSLESVLYSLKHCRPGRLPLYRDGDLYGVDPYHVDARFWVSRLDLVPLLEICRNAQRTCGEGKEFQEYQKQLKCEQDDERARLVAMKMAIVSYFPMKGPQIVSVVDAESRGIRTFRESEFAGLREFLQGFDRIGAMRVREFLRDIGVDASGFKLDDFAATQKTVRLNKAGRTLKVTLDLVIRSSCEISRPLGDPEKMRKYLESGDWLRLARRLEANVKSLFALNRYAQLHRHLQLRWGFLDRSFPANWIGLEDGGSLADFLKEACQHGKPLEVVVGSSPGWEHPWARARKIWVSKGASGYGFEIVDEDGLEVDRWRIQAVRWA